MKRSLGKILSIPKSWREISKSPLYYFTNLTIKNDQVVDLPLFPHIDTYLLCKPEHIEYVLVKNNKNYIKGRAYRFLQIILGNGLLTSEGDFWRIQRRIAQPAFHRQILSSFTHEIELLVEKLITSWNLKLDSGTEVLNVADEMMKLTVSITANILFGADITGQLDRIIFLVGDINEKTSNILKTPLPIPLWIPTSNNKDFKKFIDELNLIINDIIAKRRGNPSSKREDLLQMLMDAVDEETGEKMNDIQLKDEVMTLFLAGSETSSNALAWSLYLLCQHPVEYIKVMDEIKELNAKGIKGLEALKNLQYLNLVIQESLRIYPPAWILSREALHEDMIGGLKIKKGTQLYISIHGMHSHPKHWEEPGKFKPERFNGGKLPKFTYFPFGGGPRLCIGAELARMEILLSLYKILFTFSFSLVQEVVPEPLITLRPKNGLHLMIQKASENSISFPD